MNKFYVYIFVDARTELAFYVGKGSGYRIARHFDGNSHSKKIQALVKQLGDDLRIDKIEGLTESEAFQLERSFITIFGRIDLQTGPLMNRTSGGQGSSGRHRFKHSKATKLKIAAAIKGKKRNSETLNAMRVAARKRYADPVQRSAWENIRQMPKVISCEGRKRMSNAARATHQKVGRNRAGRFTSEQTQ